MLKRRKCRVQIPLLSGVLSCPSVSLPTVGLLLTPHPAASRALFLKGIPATWESLGCSPGRGGAHAHPRGSERPTGKCGLGLKSCCHGGINLPPLHKARERGHLLTGQPRQVGSVRATGAGGAVRS